jgi:hypothetical protein
MTKLKTKVTNALNETRMLILGAQILLGFQLNAVFQPRFARLAEHARWLDLAGLALMSAAAACLIAPAPFHRVTEGGRDTARLHGLTSCMAEWALVPFGLCIGIDVFIVTELMLGLWPSIVAGVAFTAAAAALWYGIEAASRHRTRGGSVTDPPEDTEAETALDERISTLLIEARVILPGAQALLGFQFAAFLTTSFEYLPPQAKLVHLGCLACVALSVLLLMAPAAYHRLAAGGEDRPDVEQFGNTMVLASLLPLALGLSGEFYVVFRKVGGAEGPAIAAMAVALSLFFGLWFAYPLLARARRARAGRRALPKQP